MTKEYKFVKLVLKGTFPEISEVYKFMPLFFQHCRHHTPTYYDYSNIIAIMNLPLFKCFLLAYSNKTHHCAILLRHCGFCGSKR